MKKRLFSLLLAVVMLVGLLPMSVFAAEGTDTEATVAPTTIYVDATNGAADAAGTSEAPVKTIDQAMVLVADNGTIEVSNTSDVLRGTVTKPVTIKGSTGTEDVEVSISSGVSGTVKFENLTFDSTVMGNYASSGYESLDLVYSGCNFNNAAGNCVYITAPINSLTVTGCTFAGVSGDYSGQYLVWPYAAKTVTITNNEFTSTVTRGAIHLGDGHSEGTTATITGNTFSGFERVVQLALKNSATNSITIQGNTLSDIGQRTGSSKAAYEYGLVFVHESYIPGTTTVSISGNSYDNYGGAHIVYSENVAENSVLGITFGENEAPDGMTQFAAPVAQVGGTNYMDLQQAIDAAGEGATVTLLGNVALTDGLEVASDDVITLDLAGYTLSYASSEDDGNAAITNKGTLTITGNGTVTYSSSAPSTANAYATNTISNVGILTIENGTFTNTTSGGASYVIDNNSNGVVATTTINGGTITNTGVAIRMFANSGTHANTVTINGGAITGKRAIWLQLPQNDATVAPPVDININGGTLTAIPYEENTYTYDMAIYAYSYGNSWSAVDVDVTGGTIDGDIAMGGGQKNGVASLDITGGTFMNDVYTYGTATKIAISGGTFSTDPPDNLAVGYEAKSETVDEVTTYTVSKKEATTTSTTVGGLVIDTTDSTTMAGDLSEIISTTDTTETPIVVEAPKAEIAENATAATAEITTQVTAIATATKVDEGTGSEGETETAAPQVNLSIEVVTVAKDEAAEIEEETATVTFNTAAVQAINSAADTNTTEPIVLSVENVTSDVKDDESASEAVAEAAAVYKITLKKGETEVFTSTTNTDTKATATISVPKPANVTVPVVYYVNGTEKTKVDSTLEDGKVIFTTNHFSMYTIQEAPAELTDIGRSLSLNAEIHINQFVTYNKTDLTQDYICQNGGILVWTAMPTAVSVDDTSAEKVEGLTYSNTSSAYWAQTSGIAAKEYADELYICAYLKLTDGSYIYTNVKEYSVQIYCQNKLSAESTASENLKNLCTKMLDYGAAAQVYFEYNTDDLANANLSTGS